MAKFCKNCGAELLNEEAVTCLECGASQTPEQPAATYVQPQPVPPQQQTYQQPYAQPYSQPQPQPYAQPIYPNPYAAPASTSIGGWIGWLLLCSILPIIGHIIMICTAKDDSTKNFAKAYLIFFVIAFVLGLIMAMAGVSILSDL